MGIVKNRISIEFPPRMRPLPINPMFYTYKCCFLSLQSLGIFLYTYSLRNFALHSLRFRNNLNFRRPETYCGPCLQTSKNFYSCGCVSTAAPAKTQASGPPCMWLQYHPTSTAYPAVNKHTSVAVMVPLIPLCNVFRIPLCVSSSYTHACMFAPYCNDSDPLPVTPPVVDPLSPCFYSGSHINVRACCPITMM